MPTAAEMADLYAPHSISSKRTGKPRTWRLCLSTELPSNRVWLEFLIRSVPTVDEVSFGDCQVIVTLKSDTRKLDARQLERDWQRTLFRICDHVINVLGWKSSETVINGTRQGWDNFPGTCMLL